MDASSRLIEAVMINISILFTCARPFNASHTARHLPGIRQQPDIHNSWLMFCFVILFLCYRCLEGEAYDLYLQSQNVYKGAHIKNGW